MSTIANVITVVVDSFCMGRPQLVLDDHKKHRRLPELQPEIFLKIEHCVLNSMFVWYDKSLEHCT